MDNSFSLEPGKIRIFRSPSHRPVSTLAVRTLGLHEGRALILDGKAILNPYWMVRVCKKLDLDEKNVLERIKGARAFTAYQVKDILLNAERSILDEDFIFLGAVGLTDRFHDKELTLEEGRWLLADCRQRFRDMVVENQLYSAVADEVI